MGRSFASLRRTMTAEVLHALLEECVVSGATKALYISFVPPVDTPMSGEEKAAVTEVKFPQLPKPRPPEMEAFAVMLLLITLTDKKEKDKALECASTLVPWLKTFNRRTL